MFETTATNAFRSHGLGRSGASAYGLHVPTTHALRMPITVAPLSESLRQATRLCFAFIAGSVLVSVLHALA